MASDELAKKLQRRCQLNEEKTEDEVDLNIGSKATTENSETSSELSNKLQRRNQIIDTLEDGGDVEKVLPSTQVFNPYTEFKEFTRKQIIDFQKTFNKYDTKKDKFIDFDELKVMMEKLGVPQTHLALKAMIKEVDEDNDNKISFKEFLLIFRKAAAGELEEGSGLLDLYSNMEEIDVHAEGVGGAKSFFESKINKLTIDSKFEAEIKAEQEEKRIEQQMKAEKQAAFKDKANFFAAEIVNAGK
ncbi:unnamed protein product [Owenia fusiformis]|uniref:Uncharacterized protein n=1 Tax=Owenia fusiformis TaxID=6347 RepID=A0A8J1UWI5_OWEFU|nr:unnamed protein product [Owenia fusiformis]